MSSGAYKEATEAPATALRRRKVGRVNYVVESATPAMLCLVRAAASKPYTPLSSAAVYDAVQPHDMSSRPSSFVAHQALMDFYKVCDGFYGIDKDAAEVQQLAVFDAKKPYSGGSTASGGGPSSTSAVGAGIGHNSVGIGNGPSVGGPAMPSPDDPNLLEKLNDYRIAQLRRNAQHVDNAVYHGHGGSGGAPGSGAATGGAGVCHYYRTAEGCLRGPACPFAHLDKAGQPVHRGAK